MAVQKRRKIIVGASLWLAFLLVPLLVYLHWVGGWCLVKPFGITTVQATIMDSQGHPIQGAGIDVFDLGHNPVASGRATDVADLTGAEGQVSDVYRAKCCYYVQADAVGYEKAETKVAGTSPAVSVVLVLKQAPLPPYPLTTIRAKVIDADGQPVEDAMMFILDQSGQYLDNRYFSDVTSDKNGIVEKTVRTGGAYTIQVDGDNYPRVEKKVVSRPGVMSVVIVLKR